MKMEKNWDLKDYNKKLRRTKCKNNKGLSA